MLLPKTVLQLLSWETVVHLAVADALEVVCERELLC